MKKNLVTYVVVGIIFILVINIIYLVLKPQIDTGIDPNSFGNLPVTVDDKNGLLTFSSDSNKTITVRDFRKDSDVVAIDNVTYQIDSKPTESDVTYQIYYDDVDRSITISLLQEPLNISRLNAEKDLLDRLDVESNVLCDMNIIVNTPSFVDEQLSGSNLGLSFCDGAVSL